MPTRSPAATSVSTVSSTAPAAEPITTIDALGVGRAVVVDQPVAAAGPRGELVHDLLDDARARPGGTGCEASRAWKKTSGFWAVPRTTGASGRQPARAEGEHVVVADERPQVVVARAPRSC